MRNSSSPILAISITAIYFLIYAANMFVFRNNEWMLIIGCDLLQTIGPLIPVNWLYKGYLRGESRDRMFWLFLALGIFCYSIAMMIWNYYEIYLKVDAPFPSIADLFWFVMGLFIFTAITYQIVINREKYRIVQIIYDALIILTVAIPASWDFILKPMLSNAADQSILYKMVYVSYPIGVLGMLFVLLCFFNFSNVKLFSKVFWVFFFGMCNFLVADFWYLYLVSEGLFTSYHPVNLLWLIGIFMIGLSSFYSNGPVIMAHYHDDNEPYIVERIHFLSIRLWGPYLGVFVIFLIMVQQEKGFTAIAFGSMLSILLIIFRQIYTLMENHKLLAESIKLNKELEDKVQQRTQELFKKNQQLEKSIKKQEYLANHDHLTGLPNRRLFEKQLNNSLLYARKHDEKLALLFLDLDRFKMINDTLSHAVGDLVLQQTAKRFQASISQNGVIFRQGGDEFLAILPNADKTKASAVAENILQSLRKGFRVKGHELIITSSIGISLYPDDGEEIEILTKRADSAMYVAKRFRNQHIFFDTSMDIGTHTVLDLEKDLRYALDRNEFSLVYQPEVHIQSGEMIGVEALIRWKHPVRGMIPPQKFIPLAEETGLIIPLGLWVLETACKQWKKWRDKGFPLLTIAVNISTNQFLHKDFLHEVRRVIHATGMNPEYLELEITENIPFVSERAAIFLVELQEMGIKISIDDFGTGYSSLQYLKRLPINKLKIDQSFIKELPDDPNDASIVQTIIAMAQNLKLEVVAEGVETLEQLTFLQKHHCQLAQGYVFSRPLAPEEFEYQFQNITMLQDRLEKLV